MNEKIRNHVQNKKKKKMKNQGRKKQANEKKKRKGKDRVTTMQTARQDKPSLIALLLSMSARACS